MLNDHFQVSSQAVKYKVDAWWRCMTCGWIGMYLSAFRELSMSKYQDLYSYPFDDTIFGKLFTFKLFM